MPSVYLSNPFDIDDVYIFINDTYLKLSKYKVMRYEINFGITAYLYRVNGVLMHCPARLFMVIDDKKYNYIHIDDDGNYNPMFKNLSILACDTDVLYTLGIYYYNICDYIEAKKYFEKPADYGHIISIRYMAKIMKKINASHKDITKYYVLAINAGDIKSINSYDKYLHNLIKC